jgi:hypothetical protein
VKIKALTIVLLRVVAVFVISQGILYAAQFFGFAYQAPNVSGSFTLGILTAAIAPLAMGIIIWALAPYIAALAVRKLPPSIEMGGLMAEGLAHAAFVVIGVCLIVTTIPSLVTIVLRSRELNGSIQIALIAGRASECLLGIGLIVGSHTMSAILLRLRYAGTSG